MDNYDSFLEYFERDEQVYKRQEEADCVHEQKKLEEQCYKLRSKIARLEGLNTELVYCQDDYEMRFFNYQDEISRLKKETLRLKKRVKLFEDNALGWRTKYQSLAKEFTWFAWGVVAILSTMLFVPKIIALF